MTNSIWYYDPYDEIKEFEKIVLQKVLEDFNNITKESNDLLHLENEHFSYPKTNIYKEKLDTGEVKYYIEMIIPGFRKDEIQVSIIDNNTLLITGKKEKIEKKDKKTEFVEFKQMNKFKRKIIIPNIQQQNKINAKLEDGILKIETISGKRINKVDIEIE